MYKWIIGAIIVFSLLATYSISKFGLGPASVPIIKPSNFETPETLGLYLHRQLYQRLTTSSPIIFGFDRSDVYEQKVVESLINHIDEDLKGKVPQILIVPADQSYTQNSDPAEIQKKYGDKFITFTLVNLIGTQEGEDMVNCEKEKVYSVWLECTKKQKVRQINHAKKVDLQKPIAIVETQSEHDVMIYIRE
jgi:hypothetical protein